MPELCTDCSTYLDRCISCNAWRCACPVMYGGMVTQAHWFDGIKRRSDTTKRLVSTEPDRQKRQGWAHRT